MAELILTASGPGTWIVPAGVTSIQVECWGGGGSAGWAKTNAIAVTPGQTVCYHVGAGGAARSGANLAGLDGEDTWLNVSVNAAPASVAVGCLAQNGRNGNHGATVAGGASFVNGGAIGDTSRNGRNNNGVNAAGSAIGGSGASTPLSQGDVAAFIGTADVEGAGGNAGSGGDGRIRITDTAAPTAPARRVAVVMV